MLEPLNKDTVALAFLDFFTGGFPSGDTSGHVFHIGVTEFGRSFGRFLVSFTLRATAIGNNRSALIGRKRGGEIIFYRIVVDRARDAAFVIRLGPVHINDDGLLGFGQRFDFTDAGIGEFRGERRKSESCRDETQEYLFHRLLNVTD